MTANPGRRPSSIHLVGFRFPTFAVLTLPLGNDRAHIYLIDPHGDVMMRWPAAPDGRRMIRDLERLLRASQIG